MKVKYLLISITLLIVGTTSFGQEKAAKMRTNMDPIMVGDIAPDFTLTDPDGNKIQLSKAQSPVVLIFYRGYW